METNLKHRRVHKMRPNFFQKPISKRFIDAFPKFENNDGTDDLYFYEVWQASPFYDASITKSDLEDIYNHLLARYYNWHYVYLDDLGIALNTMHIIHDYWPNAKERLKLAKDIRDLSLDEFKKSGIMIDSQGSNPKVSTNMDELIDLVDSQNASFQLKSEEQALRAKFMSLYDGIMDDFIDRFKDLFTKLYAGVNSYLYQNPVEEEDEE